MKRAIRSAWAILSVAAIAGLALSLATATTPVSAQTGPTVVDPNLGVRTVVSGLVTPSSLAFLGPNDFLVLEKNTGQVKRVVDGVVQGVVLDLSVNFASERGLLGIALHPRFPANPGVYLFWSCRSTAPLDADPFRPEEQACADDPAAMAGQPDSNDLLQVPLLGNRVDRFHWTDSGLVFDHNLLRLRAFQHDGAPEPQGRTTPPSRHAATTTAACWCSGPTGSCMSRLAIWGDAVRPRTCRRGRPRPPPMTSSADPSLTTPT